MKKIGAVLLVACAVQGCSSGSPSQSEIEEAVTSAFKASQRQQCDRILIENIKKANGIQVEDSIYQIMATFDVRVEPVGGKDEIAALRAEQKELEGQIRDVDNEIKAVGKAEGEGMYATNPSWLVMHPEAVSEQMRPLIDYKITLQSQKTEIDVKVERKVKEVIAEWGPEYCYVIMGTGFGTGQYGGFTNKFEAITEGSVHSYERTFNMVKTDNGWMEMQ